jgi:hypothetical protein
MSVPTVWVHRPLFALGISRVDPPRYTPWWLTLLPSLDDHTYDLPVQLVSLTVVLGIHTQPVVIDTDEPDLDIVWQVWHVVHFGEQLDWVT